MKILITGITGFIGQHLSYKLLQEGYKVCAIIRNTAAKDTLEARNVECYIDSGSTVDLVRYFNMEKFDGVIHCASCFLGEHKPEDVSDLVNSNVLFATRLLESSVKTNVNWFINTGTFWQHYENQDYAPVNLYAATKQAYESIAVYYIDLHDINFVTLKLSDTYGPNDTRPKIFNLWKKIAEAGEVLEMSKGEQFIDIIHVDDVVDAYMTMLKLLRKDSKKTFKGKSFAVSSGNHIRLKDLAEIFAEITNRKLNIVWGKRPYRKREVMVPWNQGEKIPGWSPKVTLEEGIAGLFNDEKISYENIEQ